MTREIKWGIGAILVLLLIILVSSFSSQKERIERLQNDKEQLLQKALSFSRLSTQWGASKRKSKLLAKLGTIMQATLTLSKGKNTILTYKALNESMIDALSHAILASDATIVSFDLHKDDTTAELSVEIAP